eukprot:135159-Rhodomonas_salina.4
MPLPEIATRAVIATWDQAMLLPGFEVDIRSNSTCICTANPTYQVLGSATGLVLEQGTKRAYGGTVGGNEREYHGPGKLPTYLRECYGLHVVLSWGMVLLPGSRQHDYCLPFLLL